MSFLEKLKEIFGGEPAVGHRVKTDTIFQMEAVECGAASLAMVLAYHGLWMPLEKLRALCGVNRDGSQASNILRAARAVGCSADGYRWSVERLMSQPDKYPLVIHWEFCHFVVLEGIKGDIAYINDPGMGHREIPIEEFRTSYTGVALYIRPGNDFKPAGKPYSIVSTMAKKLWEDKWAAVFLSLVGLFLIVPGLASPIFSQIFLDEILSRNHPDWLFNLLLAMGVSLVMSCGLAFLQSWCLTRWQEKLTISDSSHFFWHLLRLPVQFFQQRFSGEIASRVAFHESIAGTLSGSMATTVLDFFIAIFYLTLLFQYSVSLTLIGIAFNLVNVAMFFLLRKRLVELSMRNQQEAGKTYGVAMNGLSMIETIKANGDESDFFSKWAGHTAKTMMGAQEIQLYSQTATLIPTLLAGVNTALIMTVGGFSIMDGVMTAGIFMAFQSLMGKFQEPFGRILSLGQTLQSTEIQMQRIEDVYKYEPDHLNYPDNPPTEFDRPRLSGKVEIRDLRFGYSPLSPPLFVNFSMTLEPGRWVAVVGPSGSGKSTVAKIVTGLYEEWKGQILFDDVDRRQIPRDVIVNSVACVDQDIYLLSGTIRDNITLFNPLISKSDVIRAAQDACIHDDILQLEGGYEAEVSESGSNFSGGQRQRIEIARALATNPSVLVLDEATSALDPIVENRILQNIRRRGCACLIVAHRLSTIRDADEIIVLDKGSIVERGNHRELMAMNNFYARLISNDKKEGNA